MPRAGAGPRPTRLGAASAEEAAAEGGRLDCDGTERRRCLPAETPQLLSALFVAVATILGTGILALPVKLAHCGLGPFLLSFVLVLLMQLATVFLMVDLLQRTHAALSAGGESGTEGTPGAGPAPAAAPAGGGLPAGSSPDLHRMGRLLLGPTAARVFDAAVLLHFLAAMVSYNLAGSEAYAELLGLNYRALILPFWGLYSGAVLLGSGIIQPVISVMTVLKCSIFLVVLGAVAAVGSLVGVRPREDWARAAEPFLISTFALGGVVNTMPVTYAQLPFRSPQGPGLQAKHAALHANAVLLRRYRASVVGGVLVCFVLNIVWCVCVLQIVPQTAGGIEASPSPLNELDVSLESAAEHGQVSTVPLVAVITSDPRTKQFRGVSDCVNAFIVISVSVSFMTLGAGLKHVLDGFAYGRAPASAPARGGLLVAGPAAAAPAEAAGCEDPAGLVDSPSAKGKQGPVEHLDGNGTALHQDDVDSIVLDPPLPCALRFCIRTVQHYRVLLYLVAFGLVLLLAQADPEGFIIFIEVFGSFALNLECGVFISVMAWNSQSSLLFAKRDIPIQGSRTVQLVLIGFTGLLFSAACVYDVLSAGAAAMGWGLWIALIAGSALVAGAAAVLRVLVCGRGGELKQRNHRWREVT